MVHTHARAHCTRAHTHSQFADPFSPQWRALWRDMCAHTHKRTHTWRHPHQPNASECFTPPAQQASLTSLLHSHFLTNNKPAAMAPSTSAATLGSFFVGQPLCNQSGDHTKAKIRQLFKWECHRLSFNVLLSNRWTAIGKHLVATLGSFSVGQLRCAQSGAHASIHKYERYSDVTTCASLQSSPSSIS